MAVKYRQLHTKILDSFSVNEMPDDTARLSWALLPLILDREGRGIYLMPWIRSKLFPLRTDISFEKLQDIFNWFEQHEMIYVYEVNGHKYFCIPPEIWVTYQTGTQKETKSVLPPLPENFRTISGVFPEVVEVAASASESDDVSASENAFKVYEKNIGMMTPFIADGIDNWLKTYPEEWIPAAIDEAVKNSARNFKYCDAILKRWAVDGFRSEKKKVQPAGNQTQDIVAAAALKYGVVVNG